MLQLFQVIMRLIEFFKHKLLTVKQPSDVYRELEIIALVLDPS
jgi:hypothetical protein